MRELPGCKLKPRAGEISKAQCLQKALVLCGRNGYRRVVLYAESTVEVLNGCGGGVGK